MIFEQWSREYNTFRPHSSLGYGDEAVAPLRFDAEHPSGGAEKDNPVRSGAASCTKATRETRTRDLSFTKAPLYQLS